MSGIVRVFVVSPITRSERRYDLHLTVGQLKLVTGIPADQQVIDLYNTEEEASSPTGGVQPVVKLSEEDRPLGYYGVRDGQALKVSDSDSLGGSVASQYTDVSQVDKFELTEEEYAERRDTVRAYKERNKLGRFAPQDNASAPSNSAASRNVTVGSRCEVDLGEIQKRGTVRFVGPTKFGTTDGREWVGIEYDEPVGKNDGSVNGDRYFLCKPKFGGFVRPEKVKAGEFPPEDLGFEEEEEM